MTHEPTLVPVTVLTGFLGAGKTTLLNYILTQPHGMRIAVIENEFGEIGIDHALVINADEEIFEMNNGCICCTVRGDLIRILSQLMRRRDKFDYILLETTGLANPAPVAQTFFVDEELREQFELDGIVTLADAKHLLQHIDSSSECKEQIAFADVILLNKTDLVTADELAAVEARIRSVNGQAQIHKTAYGQVDLSKILHVKAFDLAHKAKTNPEFLVEELPFEWMGLYQLEAGQYELQVEEVEEQAHAHHHHHHADGHAHAEHHAHEHEHGHAHTHAHHHDHADTHDHAHAHHHHHHGHAHLSSIQLTLLPTGSAAQETAAKRQSILLFAEGKTQTAPVLPGRHLYELPVVPHRSAHYPLTINEHGTYALFSQYCPHEVAVTITKDHHVIQPVAQQEYEHSHEHDADVTSVGLEAEGNLDPLRFQEWISYLLREKGQDIFRMKGIISILGEPNRFIFQAVHMQYQTSEGEPWGQAARRNQLVFIGRNLNRAELTRDFYNCLKSKP